MNPTVSGPPKIPAGRRSSHSPRPAPGALPAPPERCPYCRRTSGVQPITGISPKVQAWSCVCGTNWAITSTPCPAYLVDLCAAVEEIGRLRWRPAQIVALADAAPTITNEQLRDRLLALAESCTR
jgi:hypothetical protein